MNLFDLNQISGLLLFFSGISLINWRREIEDGEHMKKKSLEANLISKPRWEDLQDSRDMIRKSLLYSILGLVLTLMGVALFFTAMD